MSWTPAFPGQRPPFTPGNLGGPGGREPLHGAYSEATLEPLRVAIDARLAVESPAYAAADDHARRVLANQLARIEVVHRWLNENGVIDDRGNPRPVFGDLVKWENAARQMMEQLGMTTASRVSLGREQIESERAELQLQAQQAIAKALVVAARFVPSDQRQTFMREVLAEWGFEAGDVLGGRVFELDPAAEDS